MHRKHKTIKLSRTIHASHQEYLIESGCDLRGRFPSHQYTYQHEAIVRTWAGKVYVCVVGGKKHLDCTCDVYQVSSCGQRYICSFSFFGVVSFLIYC